MKRSLSKGVNFVIKKPNHVNQQSTDFSTIFSFPMDRKLFAFFAIIQGNFSQLCAISFM